MSNIRVAVRVRPLNEREKEKGSREIIEVNRNSITIENVKVVGIPEFGDSRCKFKEFCYDHCYNCLNKDDSYATQQQVFQDLGAQVLTSALDGFNACVFAYGQTGTGKTHTMMGYPGDAGLIPRICEGLFQSISECSDENVTCRVDVSYFEIYNEKVRDLLTPDLPKQQNEKPALRVREHPKGGPYVQGLSWHRVREFCEVEALLDRGNEERVTAETYIHDRSSRSHAIITVSFTQARLEENRPSEIVSKIHLVDLAGSEKADPSSRPDFRKRLKEGSSINRSLVALGYVIKTLAERSLLSWSTDDVGSLDNSPAGPNKQRLPFIPYRDSPLTYLLKDSLGGNSKTIMIATITPASIYYSETLSTLRYAQRAKNIINKPQINEDTNVSLIRELRKEIEKLREMLASAQKGGDFVSLQDSEDTIIAEKLHENEEMAKQLTQSWMGKWSSTHDIMKDTDLSIRNLHTRNNSMGVMIDSQLPYLVGMDDDVLSTGIVIFHLKEGETTVGREDAETAQDIVLMGPNIQREHCVIHHGNGEVMVHPLDGAMCSIQGLECIEPTRLTQGDYVTFGGDQVFRFNNPAEAAKLRENRRIQGSFNALDNPYMSFAGLSRASSYSSLGTDDSNFLSPNSQLARSYPNRRRHSDIVIYAASDLCHELERRHHSEHDRIAEARLNLDQLHRDHERAEEQRLEKEEEMYARHEQHRHEIAEQKAQLARLVEENERARRRAEEELQLARESLAAEKLAFKKELDDQRRKLKGLQSVESSGFQTEPPTLKTSSTDALEVMGVAMGTDSVDGEAEESPAKKARRVSIDEELKALENNEFSRRMSYRETEESLSIQQEDMEDQYEQTRERIEEKMSKIRQIEEEYREMDKEYLNEMSQQTAVVEALHKKEVQLEVYLQEHEELMNVSRDVPRPLRSACSEMHLVDPGLHIPEYPQKTSSLRDVHAATTADNSNQMNTPQINVLSASADSVKSDSVTMTTNSRAQKAAGRPTRDKAPAMNITNVARDVTSRLYKAPEPKFKYVPKEKEEEVIPAPRPARIRDANARSSPSRFFNEHSPSPKRSVHSPSPLRQTGKGNSPSPARDKVPKRGASPQPTKPPLKKAAATASEKKGKATDSKVMSVRNKPEVDKKDLSKTRATSPSSKSDGAASPDRLSPVSGGIRLPAAKLRLMASASSLASVPESVSEETEEPVSYVVKRRDKKGRTGHVDDEFRTHSAPDSQNMEKALDEYTLQMMASLASDKQDNERSVPLYNTSFSVDDSDLQREDKFENKSGEVNTDEIVLENMEQTEEDSDNVVFTKDTDSDSGKPNVVLGKRDHTDVKPEIQSSPPVSPRKRSKSEGADDNPDWLDELNDNMKEFDKMDTEVAQNERSFSDDSLNASDVSADSLENGDKKFRLTQSLPAYLICDEKPTGVSDDSLNDSLEEKKDAAKDENMEVDKVEPTAEQTDMCDDSKHKPVHGQIKNSMNDKLKTGKVLTKTDVECYETFDASDKPQPTLVIVALPQIDICDGTATDAATDTGTMTEINCEDSQIQTTDTACINEVSDTSKCDAAKNLTVVNLPNVSFLSNTDKSLGQNYKEDMPENEKERITVDQSINDSNQVSDKTMNTTNEKVKHYVEEIVDGAKERLIDKRRSEPESAIETPCNASDNENLNTLSKDKIDTDAINETLPVCDPERKNEADSLKSDSNQLFLENSVSQSGDVKADTEETTSNEENQEQRDCPSQKDNESNTDISGSITQASENSKPNAKDIADKEIANPNSEIQELSVQTDQNQDIANSETKEIQVDQETNEQYQPMETDANSGQILNEIDDAEVQCSDTDITEMPLTKSVGVGTSLECLAMEDAETAPLGSDDSLGDPEKELQVLQDALDQLPARPSASGPQLSTARRAARQRAMIRQRQRAGDSDGIEPCSDDSPASGNLSKSSSRPGSGSRRRRRPHSKLNEKSKQRTDHTSDDYDSSENDSVYTDESIEDKVLESQTRKCQNGNDYVNPSQNFVITDSLENSDTDEMSHLFKKHCGKSSSRPKQRHGSTEIEEGPDGKRTVGIQTPDMLNGRSGARHDLSDYDGSFFSGELNRNMTVSPISLWTTDKTEDFKNSPRHSSSSSGVIRSGNDPEKSMTTTPLSTSRSSTKSASVFLENSNLGRGVTDVWSSSASDLRPLPRLSVDLSYMMETESMIPAPSPSSLEFSEDNQNNELFVTSPGAVPRPECSTPKISGRNVSITYPESQVEKASNLDYSTPITFEVTVNEDNTNILYNVEKTEYKTYALRNGDPEIPKVIPDTIHVNLTEKITSQTQERFVSNTSENIKFENPNQENTHDGDILESVKALRSTYSSERETETVNDKVKSDKTKEKKEYVKDNTQYKVPSDKNSEESVKVKKAKLQQSGIVESTDIPGNKSDTSQNDMKVAGELSNMDESDYTSDYGTFISVDGRRCSDSGEESTSPGISPRASHISLQQAPMNEATLSYTEAIIPFAPLETSIENTDVLYSNISPQQSQQICCTEDIVTPLVIAARTEQSSPVQFIHNNVLEQSNDAITSNPNEADDTDSGSCSTVRHIEANTSLDVEIMEPADVENEVESKSEKHNRNAVEYKQSQKVDKSCSSADELFISLEQTESNSSTCSSEYRTPQQSPRYNNDTSEQVSSVVIPDLDDTSTPRVEDEISAEQGPMLTSSPKVLPSVRTVSVNTEINASANNMSPQSARVREVFGGPHDPIHTEATRREIEAKIERLQHNVRSLSDSAISSDYTDCDSSSPRGNRIYDSDGKPVGKPTCKLTVKSSKTSDSSNTDPRRTLNFESGGVKKSPFKDSGSIVDEETSETSDEEIKDQETESAEEKYMKGANEILSSSKRSKARYQFLPAIGPIGKFPETIVGAVLAIKPYPLQRSASLDSIATLVNAGTSLSRAVRDSQSIEDMQAVSDGPDKSIQDKHIAVLSSNVDAVDENENLLSSCGLDSQNSDRPLSPGEIGIGQGSIDDMLAAVENGALKPETDLPMVSDNARIISEKATSMSFLDDAQHTPECKRSLSESNMDDFDDTNDTSCTSNDSITFVFVGKEFAQNADGYQEYTSEANAPYEVKISDRGDILDSSSSDNDSGGVILSRSASGESVLIEDNTEDQISTHSASEEIEEIIKSKNQTNLHVQDISNESQPNYEHISEEPLSNRKDSMDDDSAPLRHRFGIDESVLPIAERSVSADNIPKQLTLLKDLTRSRSTSMLDMAAAENEESESGIFPPALSYVDEDQTDPSVSLRTMSEGALEQFSQRSMSDRGATYSDQTSSEFEDSSSGGAQSVCSNASSVEEIVENYTIDYTSNDPKFKHRAPQPQNSDEDDEMRVLEEEDHIREVLMTVEKLLFVRPALIDKGTSTESDDITVTDVPDDHCSMSDSGTQTLGDMPTVLQPNQIMLPALAAPFRAQSADSFGLGRHGQDIELSERAENWCTLGELMIETTQLLRTINEKLPDVEKRASVTVAAESQAILKQWQEISIQTGTSLDDLHTVGLQTDESLCNEFLPAKNASNENSRATQVDITFKMNNLERSEMCTDDLLTFSPLTCEKSVQNDGDDISCVSKVEEICTASQQTNTFASSRKQNENLETAAENESASKETTNTCLNLSTSTHSPNNASAKSKGSTQTAIFVPQIKAELGLVGESNGQPSEEHNEIDYVHTSISPRGQNPMLTLTNTPEMDELRKEHHKLMENLRKASEDRKARKDALKSRKQIPSELDLEGNGDINPSFDSLDNSFDATDTSESNDMHTPDTRSSVSSSLASPQEFVKINIQMDRNSGITIENLVYQERKKKEPTDEHPDETHTHSWELVTDDVEKPTWNKRRAGSGSSVSSSDTCVSLEIANVMASPAKDSKKFTDEREGASNPVHLDEESEVGDVDDEEEVDSSMSIVVDDIVPREFSKKETIPYPEEKKVKGNREKENNDDPMERASGGQPTFIRSETSPKVKYGKPCPQISTSPELLEPGNAEAECVQPNCNSEKQNLPRKQSPLQECLPKRNMNKDEFANEDIIIPETHTKDHSVQPLSIASNMSNESFRNENTSKDDIIVENVLVPVSAIRNESLQPSITETIRRNKADSLSRHSLTSEHSDDAIQASVEFSDDCTQTDPDTSIESVVNLNKDKRDSNKPEKVIKKERHNVEEQKSPENLKNELEKLHNQRQHMIEMLGMSRMPPSLTVELLEAKLNYCIGQTDLLLDNLEDNVRQERQNHIPDSVEHQKAIDFIEQYRTDLKKSKEDINECRERLKNRKEMGLGRGRTPYRKSDLQRRAHVDAFKLERMREQQDYDRSRRTHSKGGTPHQGNTPLRGNTPRMGNSPVVTPRSEWSRSSSPTYSPGYMTPREHKIHLVDLRRQLISDVMEEETRHRSESPSLYSSPQHSRSSRPRDGSLGFLPRTSVSTYDANERSSPMCPTCTVPAHRSPNSQQHLPFNRYRSPVESRYQDSFDTTRVPESMYSAQESAAILQEIEDYKKRSPGMSTPMEEMLRRSSFSSTGSQRSDSPRRDPFSPPRSQSETRSSRKGSSPRQPDYSQPLSINLDGLNDDETQPYSPYSAYARERVLPRERSPVGSGGVVRGSYELYHSRSNSQSDSSSVLSFGSDIDTSQRPRLNSLDEESVKRLRPVCADDIKARLGRHKR